jgi:uncharacterized protein (DUF302 family)
MGHTTWSLPMRFLILVWTALILATASPVLAKEPGLVVLESKLPVKETGDKLVKALEDKGIKVAARIDHAAGAKAAGLDLPPTEVILFGNPKLGTPLMQAQRTAGLDLPMKMLIWQDAKGKTQVGYLSPAQLKKRYAIKGNDEVLKTMTGALDAFAKAAIAGN